MARELWLLRHGDAEPHGSKEDAARALTERGETQARAAGTALAALGVSFAAVFASPKVRARETAALALEALGGELVEDRRIGSEFDRDVALELAAAGDRILVVGHEPDLSQVIHDLTGARVDFKKGGVAVVRLDRSAGGELVALLRPKELAAIAAQAARAR